MAKKMLIDATHPEETRVVVVDGQKVDDFDFESINKRQLAGNIYLAKVTRVEPSLQAAFVDYGGNRHGFLAFAEVHPDYYQIPVADREALLAEEAALARAEADSANDPNGGPKTKRRRGGKGRKSSAGASAEGGGETDADAFGETLEATPEETDAAPAVASGITGFDVIEPDASDATTDASDVDVAPAETALETDDRMVPSTETEVVADAAADIETADASEDDGSEDAQVEDSTEVAAASEVDESQGEASGDGAAAEASEEDAGSPDTPPSEPRSMAESAGLGDEDDVVRGDVPPQGRKPDEDEAPADGEPTADAAPEVAADIEEPVVVMDEEAGRPSAEAAGNEVVEPEAEPAEPGPDTVEPETGSVEAGEEAGAPDAPVAELEAEDGAEAVTTDTKDAEEDGAQSGAKRTRSRRRRRGKTTEDGEAATTDEAPEAEPAEASADAADIDENAAKPRRSRRGGRTRGRSKSGDEAEASPETTDREDSDEGEGQGDEVDTVGAEDPREEELAARAFRRRRYKIQDVIKSRQIMLVQVVKEERGTKGAALTTYLSLAGRYCVLMPNTARGGGISRKITNAADRKRLREVVGELEVPEGMGLIVRTAGAERTRAEIKRDYEFLLRQWEQVRSTTLESTAPCLIYEEGSLIKRAIRDLYNKDIDSIAVEGDEGYREAKDYMKMLMPSHAKNVQQYSDTTPLFIRYQVESFLNGMFSPTVQLKSGGYIVIGITEALVAIDVNSGRSTREGSIEDTAVKTNLEAADEVARQLRLRDLAGLIVIDFIDMDEGRNNRAVEKRMKDRLKNDRARIQVGRISAFGLMEMSRQRLRPGMLEATTKPCPHCHGQGFIRSDESMALAILREIEEEGVKGRSAEIVATMPVEICNYIVNSKRDHLARIEGRYGLSVQLLGDTSLTSPHYTIERAKGATRPERPVEAAVSASSLVEEHLSEDSADDEDTGETAAATARGDENGRGSEDSAGKKRRRGRRGGRRRRTADEAGAEENGRASDAEADESAEATEPSEADEATTSAQVAAEPLAEESEGNGRRRRRGRGKGRDKANGTDEAAAAADTETGETVEAPGPAEETVPQPDEDPSPDVGDTAEAPVVIEIDDPAAPVEEPADETAAAPAADAIIDGASAREDGLEETTGVIEDVAIAPEPEPQPEPMAEVADKPKRRGWWSLGR